MGILRSDRVSGLGGANAIVGSTRFVGSGGNGSGKTVTYFKDSSLAPGTSDFCAEAWVYFNFVDNTNNTQLFANLGGNFGFANDTSWAVIRIGANNQFYGWTGSAWAAFGAGAPTVNTWHYIQLVRASNVQTLYMDGTALASTVTNSNDLTNDEVCLGGRDDGSEVLDGYISNFRLTIGSSASALAGIVPSAASRVLSTDTKLLCCNDPGNVNNEDAQGIPTSTTPDNDVQMIQGFASRFVPDKGEDHGTTFADNTKFDTLSYMVPPGGKTTERYVKSTGDIVSGNLIWHIDAGNTTSYAGVTTSGATIYDLKGGSGMNGGVGIATLASGHANYPAPSWTPDNGGAWYIGSDSSLASPSNIGQHITMPYINLGNDNYTINVWVKLKHHSNQSDGHSYIISNKDGSPVSYHAHVKEVSGKGRIGAGAYYGGWNYDYAKDVDYNTVIALNQWYMLTWVNTAQYTQSMYVNGVIQKLHNANANTWNSRTSNNTPVNATSYANNETTNAWIGQIQYYSDTLTADEILQNYNAHKCRYDQ